ncbi:major facilitator superfamily domain-containing protein [Chytriomyces sp. MP71]|nr:major facilitator superfamily domain-containing protein [Chytriomyces sp. MP71]
MADQSERSHLLPRAQRGEHDAHHRMGDLRILAVAFFFVFAAFTTISAISSTVLPPLVSFNAAATLYVSFSLSNLFVASAVVDAIGSRAGLFLAACTYSAYNVANVLALKSAGDERLQSAILLPAVVLNGLGASVLWSSQGVYVARISTPSTLGKYSGAFFGYMWCSGIVGPLFMSLLLQANMDRVRVFEIVTIVCLAGPLILLYLWLGRPEPSNPYAPVASPASVVENDSSLRIETQRIPAYLKTLRILLTPSMLLLIPISYATACEQSFWNGSLPLFIRTGDASADLSIKLYLRAAISLCQTLTSFIVGPLTDRFGSRPMVLACFVVHAFCQSLLVFGEPMNNLPLLAIAYVCFGITNAVSRLSQSRFVINCSLSKTLLNQSQKLVGVLFEPSEMSSAYAGYKFHTSVGASLGFWFSKYGLDASGVPDMHVWAPIFLFLVSGACVGTFAVTSSRR